MRNPTNPVSQIQPLTAEQLLENALPDAIVTALPGEIAYQQQYVGSVAQLFGDGLAAMAADALVESMIGEPVGCDECEGCTGCDDEEIDAIDDPVGTAPANYEAAWDAEIAAFAVCEAAIRDCFSAQDEGTPFDVCVAELAYNNALHALHEAQDARKQAGTELQAARTRLPMRG